jgi:hypothetical protein
MIRSERNQYLLVQYTYTPRFSQCHFLHVTFIDGNLIWTEGRIFLRISAELIDELRVSNVLWLVWLVEVLLLGGAGGHIRIYQIAYLGAIIGLPLMYSKEPVFWSVALSCVSNEDRFLFVNTMQYFEKLKTQNFLRVENINKLFTTFREWKVEDKYSHVSLLD